LLCAIAAILTKSSTVMLPVVLGLCWWWQERHWEWRRMPWLLPFLTVSLVASGWTIWEQQYHSGAIGEEWNHTLLERVVIAGKVVWFYLGKLLWPHPLIFIYPRWQIDATSPLAYLPAVAAAVTFLALWWYRDRGTPAAFFAFAYFGVSLFPVLGFFDVYFFRYSFVGDHLQYLATIGPLVFFAASIIVTLERLPRSTRSIATPAVCALLLVVLGVLTWRETFTYTDEETLWRTTIARNPGAWIGHNNLGTLAEPEEAMAHYRRALELNPRFSQAHNNVAALLMPLGQVDDALRHWATAIEIEPTYADARYNLGSALLQLGRPHDAIPQLQTGLMIDPSNADAQYNLATALMQTGQRAEAIAAFEKARELNPDDVQVLNNLAWLLATSADAKLRNGATAVALAERADQLTAGNDANVVTTLAAAYAEAGRFSDAVAAAKRALALAPSTLVERIRRQLSLYEAGSPYRE
jgi:protein O-mannosyl-transferase